MAAEENMKEVFYDVYCSTCVRKDADDDNDICNECLNEPGRMYSHKPVKYEEKK